ncbi:MAG: hypothetical protein ACTSYK_04045, partial [Alphaproteobacteria bacterium]
MKEAVSIRPFESAGLPHLHEIREAAYHPIFESFRQMVGEAVAATAFDREEAEQGALLDDFCNPDSAHKVFVALKGSEIVGFMAVSLDEKKIGIGTRLYDFATDLMRDAGTTVATVGL